MGPEFSIFSKIPKQQQVSSSHHVTHCTFWGVQTAGLFFPQSPGCSSVCPWGGETAFLPIRAVPVNRSKPPVCSLTHSSGRPGTKPRSEAKQPSGTLGGSPLPYSPGKTLKLGVGAGRGPQTLARGSLAGERRRMGTVSWS